MQVARVDKGPIDISYKMDPLPAHEQKILDLCGLAARETDIMKICKIRQQIEKLRKAQINR
jgi:hypothetical protein